MSELEANFNKVRRYSDREQAHDDLREIIDGIGRFSQAIEQSIREAHFFRIFFLGVKFLKDTAAVLKDCKVVMEFDPTSGLWTVGHIPRNPRSRKQGVTVSDAKLDVALSDLLKVWQMWAAKEDAKEARPRRKRDAEMQKIRDDARS